MNELFTGLQAQRQANAETTASERITKLQHLKIALFRHRTSIHQALYADFHRHPSEVDLTEIYPVLSEIRHATKKLKQWMAPQRVATPLAMLGARSSIQWQPKGTVLILSPWNFPVNLTLGPLVSAVAAGNTVALKPSEHTPHTLTVLKSILSEVFPKEEVVLFEGDGNVASALLELPFEHIFFTGSTVIGQKVMHAAARQLASVTLELGGKSPTLVDEDADIDIAAKRIAWAKWLNNGQVCIAPDYVLVHHSRHEDLIHQLHRQIQAFYGDNPKASPSYGRIINAAHTDRLANLLGPNATPLVDRENHYIPPTIVTGLSPEDPLMKEEIFGPILPVLSFRNLDQLLYDLQKKSKPLALYFYSSNEKSIAKVLAHTRSGAIAINHNGLQFLNTYLPFGGEGSSGLGKAHGWYGFQAFSNPRAIFEQRSRWSAIELMTPPYGALKQKLIDFTLRWL